MEIKVGDRFILKEREFWHGFEIIHEIVFIPRGSPDYVYTIASEKNGKFPIRTTNFEGRSYLLPVRRDKITEDNLIREIEDGVEKEVTIIEPLDEYDYPHP